MMRNHNHCKKCGDVITFNCSFDWTLNVQEPELWKMCKLCRSNFIKQAVRDKIIKEIKK